MRKRSLSFSSIAMLLLATFGFYSCSNEEELGSLGAGDAPKVEVSRMSAWGISSRGAQEDTPVLHFKDEQAYSQTIANLKSMTDEERTAYFKEMGFDGAFILLRSADEEADKILDNDDENVIRSQVKDFKEKYAVSMSFNPEDPYDITPYLNFTDTDLSLVGNTDGYVVIGNRVRKAEKDYPTFDNREVVSTLGLHPGPIEPGWKEFKNASLTIKKGKYKSTMTIGRIVNGNSLAVNFTTKKKVLFWNKSVNTNYTIGSLAFHSSKFNYSNRVTCPRSAVCILNLPIETVGMTFDADVKDFQSGKCGDVKGNQNFKGVKVV